MGGFLHFKVAELGAPGGAFLESFGLDLGAPGAASRIGSMPKSLATEET